MISYSEARKLVLNNVNVLNSFSVLLNNSIGMICSEDIFTLVKIPYFNNSAMDGFSFKCSNSVFRDRFKFKISDDQNTGISYLLYKKFYLNNVIRIVTGSIVSLDFDAVVKLEDVLFINDNEFICKKFVFSGENIRNYSEDFAIGDLVIGKGFVISAKHIMVLSALGINKINVFKYPEVFVLPTGNELLNRSNFKNFKFGLIYDCNVPYVINFFKSININCFYFNKYLDDLNIFVNLLNNLLLNNEFKIIISIGGVSKGGYDFVGKLSDSLFSKTLFHGVKIRPGKPIYCSVLEDGSLFFGLPGNPIAAVVGLRFFIYPVFRKLFGLSEEKILSATINSDISKNFSFTYFLKSFIYFKKNNFYVNILDGQESFKISSFLHSNCWTCLDGNYSSFYKGSKVKVYNLDPFLF